MIDNPIGLHTKTRIGFRDQISALIPVILEHQHSFALWVDSETGHHNLLINLGDPVRVDEIELEEFQPGFLISPFLGKTKAFLRADLLISSGKTEFNKSRSLDTENEIQAEKLFQAANNSLLNGKAASYHLSTPLHNTSREDYLDLVEKGLDYIKAGTFEKIVPARKTTVPTKETSLPDLYFSLAKKYPRAFTYLISVKGIGTWIGATPEQLIKVRENQFFETVSLAGTQQNKPDSKLSEVSWTQKEIEEQALVSRYIINCFKKIRLREFEEHGPKTVVAGNLLHLKTTFKVDMLSAGFQSLGSVMLQLLHPTSAVCGMPKDESLQFLSKYEQLDRRLFSGYLGPVNIGEQTSIYVNLRCMEYHGDVSSIYAGAGVTEDSEPEKELEETELKFNTILEVLDSIS